MDTKLKALPNPGQQQPVDELQLIEQVGTWAERNFRDKRAAEWGIVEEIGEAAHCILKHRQKIRGFEKEDFFIAKLTDAFADTIIYLADWCYKHNTFFKINRNQVRQEQFRSCLDLLSERRIMQHLLQAASAMMCHDEIFTGDKIEAAQQGVYNYTAQRICNGIEYWAELYKIDLRWAVTTTWAKVKQRDWIANPDAPKPELQ